MLVISYGCAGTPKAAASLGPRPTLTGTIVFPVLRAADRSLRIWSECSPGEAPRQLNRSLRGSVRPLASGSWSPRGLRWPFCSRGRAIHGSKPSARETPGVTSAHCRRSPLCGLCGPSTPPTIARERSLLDEIEADLPSTTRLVRSYPLHLRLQLDVHHRPCPGIILIPMCSPCRRA